MNSEQQPPGEARGTEYLPWPTDEPAAAKARPDGAHGTRLGHYAVKRPLGRGGMGEVFLAWDERLERHVAIKRLRGDRPMAERQRARFRREARAIARLSHPVIVQIFDMIDGNDGECIVMEYVEGMRLDRLLTDAGMGLGFALQLAAELADGLAQAHTRGIVHRDLKCENVMVTPSGHAKILDFGLAYMGALDRRDQSNLLREGALTESGMLVGTAHAMSPEQARGGALDHRSDLFALGSVLYAMLTGREPFRSPDLLDTLRRIVSEEPEFVSELRPEIPRELGALVADLLAKHPDDRPADAHVVVRRIAAIAHALGDTGERGGVPGQGGRGGLAELSTASAAVIPPRVGPPPEQRELSRTSAVPVLRMIVMIEGVLSGGSRARALTLRIARVARALLLHFHGLEMVDPDPRYTAVFERTTDAVGFALAFHQALARAATEAASDAAARVAVHLGEVLLSTAARTPDDVPRFRVTGVAVHLCARVLAMARPKQILLTQGGFDLARRSSARGSLELDAVRWLAHGRYALREIEQPVELFEVGVDGFAPLLEPPDGEPGKRLVAPGDELTLGWRPAVGQFVPQRPNWILRERLGTGSSGEVWLAGHRSGETRVFKFCFEPNRLRALKREITLFRLISGALGHRHDIARALDWNFASAPYFIESEYSEAGDLLDWSDDLGGIAEVAMELRLALAAEVADALAAAHSVGVLHKDIKPQNVLVTRDHDGKPHAQLADFGVGTLIDRDALARHRVTAMGFTDTLALADSTNGTLRYLAPEVLDGKPSTIQADIYALGVMLYQLVAGDFLRGLAPGWERDVDDEILAQDIASMVDRAPERRPASATEVALKLRTLTQRHQERAAAEQQRQAAVAAERMVAEAQRRRRAAVQLAAVALLLLAVGLGFAYQARSARVQSERRRLQAETLIQFMLGDLRKSLEPIGKLAILEPVGEKALAYFAAVPESELSDQELDSRATALHQIGEVRFARGKLAEATVAFRDSLRLARSLAARDPENAERQFGLGQSHFWIGFSLWQQRELAPAQQQFRAYLRVSEQLVARDPRKQAWMLELAYAHSNLGSVSRDLGEVESARVELGAAAGIMESLLALDSGNESLQLELAHVHAKLGDLLAYQGEFATARLWLQRYLDGLQVLVARAPDDKERLRFLGYAHSHLGNLLRALGEVDGALAHYREDLVIAERLVGNDAEDRLLAAELALRKNKVADQLLMRGESDQAQALLSAERVIVDSLLAQDPARPQWRFAAVRSDLSFAYLLLARGQPAQARLRASAAATTLQELVLRFPEVQAMSVWLPYAWWLLGRLQQREGWIAQAQITWQYGLLLVRDLSIRSREPRLRDLHARLALALGLDDEASPILEGLDRIGYREPELTALLRELGQSVPGAP